MLCSAVTKYRRIWKTQVSSILPGIEPRSEHYPSWPIANVFVCAECEYYEALSIQRHSTESFIQKIKTTTPKCNLHQLTQITGHVARSAKHEKFDVILTVHRR